MAETRPEQFVGFRGPHGVSCYELVSTKECTRGPIVTGFFLNVCPEEPIKSREIAFPPVNCGPVRESFVPGRVDHSDRLAVEFPPWTLYQLILRANNWLFAWSVVLELEKTCLYFIVTFLPTHFPQKTRVFSSDLGLASHHVRRNWRSWYALSFSSCTTHPESHSEASKTATKFASQFPDRLFSPLPRRRRSLIIQKKPKVGFSALYANQPAIVLRISLTHSLFCLV